MRQGAGGAPCGREEEGRMGSMNARTLSTPDGRALVWGG